jgi:hypothetical protein
MDGIPDFMALAGQYYGLDWLALVFGLAGMWCLTQQKRIGFCISSVGCLAGFGAAVLSGQLGFVAYNLILVAMMMRGFFRWNNAKSAAE